MLMRECAEVTKLVVCVGMLVRTVLSETSSVSIVQLIGGLRVLTSMCLEYSNKSFNFLTPCSFSSCSLSGQGRLHVDK